MYIYIYTVILHHLVDTPLATLRETPLVRFISVCFACLPRTPSLPSSSPPSSALLPSRRAPCDPDGYTTHRRRVDINHHGTPGSCRQALPAPSLRSYLCTLPTQHLHPPPRARSPLFRFHPEFIRRSGRNGLARISREFRLQRFPFSPEEFLGQSSRECLEHGKNIARDYTLKEGATRATEIKIVIRDIFQLILITGYIKSRALTCARN